MKKFLALLMAFAMVLSLGVVAYADDEEAGFDEFELGVEGEQEVGFMTMSMVYFQPVDMAPVESATPKEGSDLHIEVDLTANENPYSFPVDGWVPYLSIDYVIYDHATGEKVLDGSMMPMAASDGPHYGNNICPTAPTPSRCPSRALPRTAICSMWTMRPASKQMNSGPSPSPRPGPSGSLSSSGNSPALTLYGVRNSVADTQYAGYCVSAPCAFFECPSLS